MEWADGEDTFCPFGMYDIHLHKREIERDMEDACLASACLHRLSALTFRKRIQHNYRAARTYTHADRSGEDACATGPLQEERP